jgi:superfamily II DNA or RNA helicase
MEKLSELSLQPSYHKGEDDIAQEFYLPCMERSVEYDRAIGFFKSSIYLIAWESLREFVANGGRMRIVCSPVISDADSEAIEEGYKARTDEKIASSLQDTIQDMLNSSALKKPTKVLAALVAQGVVEFKIATMAEEPSPRHNRLFHDKVGIFRDGTGIDKNTDNIVFKGSMNETWAGLAMDGNLESIDVYVSWGDERERQRVQSEQEYFDSLWRDEYDTVEVRNFPDLPKRELVSAAEAVEWESLVDDIVEEINASQAISPDSGPNPRTPLPHQKEALDTWNERGRQGIFEHATGSGKTFTALCAIRESLKRDEVPVVFVPNTDLLTQWKEELETTNQDLNPKVLVCGGGRTRWRNDGLLRSWTRPDGDSRIVLSTMQTAISDDFQSLITTDDHIFLIADEVHRIGSPEHRKILNFESGPRLGLSATPRRAGDPDGTEAIMDYFDGVVQPPFTLSNAIEAGRLTPYFYHIHTAILTPDEQEDWKRETKKIAKQYARLKSGADGDPNSSEYLKQLQIKRASIVKEAWNKIYLTKNIMNQHYESGDRWLVYCSEMEQLSAVADVLRQDGYDVLEYHSKMAGDRNQTLKYFESNGGIIVSIKCLDEGIDIPNATHALILASSKNPREFIQRRGRVLRKSDNKNFAHVHDAIVLPHNTDVESPVVNILEGELSRAIKFAEDAVSAKSVADLREIAIEAGIDYENISETGFEDDEISND